MTTPSKPKTKFLWAVVVAIIIATFAGIYLLQRPQLGQEGSNQGGQTYYPPTQYVRLEVSAYESSSSWMRDTSTDLPLCSTVISYSISNYGNTGATNVQLNVKVDGNIFLQDTISTLNAGAYHTAQFSLTINYDSSRYIEITASTTGSSDTYSFSVDAPLPRWASSSTIMKLYITPNDPVVKSTLNNILSNKFFLTPNWMAIRDWVANSVDYAYDSDEYGSEQWQLPRETIQKGLGDCEDFSILMVSLLRANGWDADEVYVVLGYNPSSDSYHAWVKLNLGLGLWYSLEPQGDNWNFILGDWLSLSGYEAVCQFNDVYYEEIG
ncbi:MAG: transglutaminase-like cysteine peptidase [archaeon]|nr:transglutaminase-like cysteine peptidase [archaeon]MCP8320508.1 transglutaminase-like cysteine peptidase [archaeon]